MRTKILVPLSLSPDEQPVVDKARELALAQEYQLLLLHVVDLYQIEIAMAGAELKVDDLVAYKDQLIAQKQRDAQAHLQKIADELQAKGLVVAIDIEAGRPAQTIIRTVKQHNEIAGIVMGSRHSAAMDRRFHRNIAAKVQRKSPCPVTAVQLPARYKGSITQ